MLNDAMLTNAAKGKKRKKGRDFDQAFRARKNAFIVMDNLFKEMVALQDPEAQACSIFKFVEKLDKDPELAVLNDKASAANAAIVSELNRIKTLLISSFRESLIYIGAYVCAKKLDKSENSNVKRMVALLRWYRDLFEKDDPRYDDVCTLSSLCHEVRTLWISFVQASGTEQSFPEGFKCFSHYEQYEKELNKLHALKATTLPDMWDELVIFYQQNKIDQCANDPKYRERLMSCVSVVMLLVHAELRHMRPCIEFDDNVRMMKINGEYINNFNQFAVNNLLKQVINRKKGISCCQAFSILTGDDIIADELEKVDRKKVLDAIRYINDQVVMAAGLQHDLLVLIKGEYDEMICINPLLREMTV